MNIIQATLAELEEVVKLFDAYHVFYRNTYDTEKATAFIRERIQNKESVIFLALDDAGKGIGFTQLYPLFSSIRMRKVWLLNDLYVWPEYRGQGIGKALIERAKEYTIQTGAARLLLETDKTNDIGNQLYPSVGFELNAEQNFYGWTAPVLLET